MLSTLKYMDKIKSGYKKIAYLALVMGSLPGKFPHNTGELLQLLLEQILLDQSVLEVPRH